MAVEPGERDTMERPPRPPSEPVLTGSLIWHIVLFGILMGAVSLGTGFVFWSGTREAAYDPAWGTIIFTVLTWSQLGNALAARSARDSLFRIGLLSNKPMVGAVLLTFCLQLAVIYLPFFQNVFRTIALSPADLLICLAASSIVFWVVEAEKFFKRRRLNRVKSPTRQG
jgi:Ca2+-transporting ATPase